MNRANRPAVVLASTSRYRAELLRRLLPEFAQQAPDVDETPRPGEAPGARAMRLAQAKARAVAADQPGTLVIGSDQVAEHAGTLLRKPGTTALACAQLQQCSGGTARFHTAVCVVDTCSEPAMERTASDLTCVHFRPLDAATIARYIAIEQPLDCAGSFRCEGLGVALFERMETSDPTALIGLPLIAVARLLRACGLELP